MVMSIAKIKHCHLWLPNLAKTTTGHLRYELASKLETTQTMSIVNNTHSYKKGTVQTKTDKFIEADIERNIQNVTHIFQMRYLLNNSCVTLVWGWVTP